MWRLMGRLTFGGIGIGSFVYLMVLALGIQTSAPTPQNIMSILVMSALIGILSLLFEVERWPFLVLLAIHMVGVAILVAAMMSFNHWGSFLVQGSFWLFYLFIYVAVWGIIYLDQAMRVSRINRALAERNKGQH
ncbi:DUF3021 domain-containing protein [Schleiferilactobacillus perolens]|jgi:hypothetical protein|uniref:DUF3021 domain-containing protein n=1 Tax=Schleiferilactobacillus perolens DSM 12744 TaxID=1423792 RepID=A0A0R1MIS2_9LACO|nr:DUF3021 domain-containing protein [Schleiferilactobacillus perolens]KRL07903.1 hypothetical protein FD09_GL001716 [Schleiferilactobacillus perolens DSM 12744]MCI1891481.1 DUF3021 domain-containing protein [Schleiferilactobacillus harbinensis]MCI1911897.1 DUF3021 domain-containing protein [Schleiferilactobacillus harbinensis]MCI2170477.1 DUF3021 domain-containing protein [Schleiferilactobacillus perolens]